RGLLERLLPRRVPPHLTPDRVLQRLEEWGVCNRRDMLVTAGERLADLRPVRLRQPLHRFRETLHTVLRHRCCSTIRSAVVTTVAFHGHRNCPSPRTRITTHPRQQGPGSAPGSPHQPDP